VGRAATPPRARPALCLDCTLRRAAKEPLLRLVAPHLFGIRPPRGTHPGGRPTAVIRMMAPVGLVAAAVPALADTKPLPRGLEGAEPIGTTVTVERGSPLSRHATLKGFEAAAVSGRPEGG
jgi:hypothetical protein